jgi:hypothetical protein
MYLLSEQIAKHYFSPATPCLSPAKAADTTTRGRLDRRDGKCRQSVNFKCLTGAQRVHDTPSPLIPPYSKTCSAEMLRLTVRDLEVFRWY